MQQRYGFQAIAGPSSMQVELGDDGVTRCLWAYHAPDFLAYHDDEWGFPVTDDYALFEKLSLEAFQSGLSWRTILTKRDNFRAAFANFDPRTISEYGNSDVTRLMSDAGIVRNLAKIDAVINNAKRLLAMQKTTSLTAFAWNFAHTSSGIQSTSREAALFAKQLKSDGWKFVGPTTAYAFMQATGIVNDHAPECHVHEMVATRRQAILDGIARETVS